MHVESEFALMKPAASAVLKVRRCRFRQRALLSRFKGEQGSNLVEYSITLLTLLMMLFGVVAAGEALYAYHFVSHASREATRWAAVNGSNCTLDSSCTQVAAQSDVTTFVDNIIPAGIDSSKVNVSANWPSTTGVCSSTSKAPGCPVQVTVTYEFHFPFPLFPTGPYTFSSTSQMIIAH